MSDYLYYCNNCNSLVADTYDNESISCDKCGEKMIPLHVNEEEWNGMTSGEKRELIMEHRSFVPQKRVSTGRRVSASSSTNSRANLMKCPNCGADIEGNSRECAYCGAPISSAMRKEQELVMKEGCPKCGSSNIRFQRENHGEYRKKNGKTIVHKTVGFCQDCGYTWTPTVGNGQAKPSSVGMTILWILGWIYIFPVPLMILLHRKKDMNPKLRLGIIIASWVLYGVIVLAGLLSSPDRNEDKVVQDTGVSAVVQSETENSITEDAAVSKSAVSDDQNSEKTKDLPANQEGADSDDIQKLESMDEVASDESSGTRSVSQMYATDTVNIREQASKDSSILGKVQSGDEVAVLGTEGDWSHVLVNGTDGYIKSEYLSDSSPKSVGNNGNGQNTDKNATDGTNVIAGGNNTNNAGNPDAFASYVPTGAPAGTIVVNATNHKVHKSSCPTLPEEDNRIYFNSVEEAKAHGYTDPCGNCNPF